MDRISPVTNAPDIRRTQKQRSNETRSKLLDATIVSIVEVGCEKTTTRRVAELAGVSTGALVHHFSRRADLFGAAIEQLVERRLAEFDAADAALPADPTARLGALLDILWSDFTGPNFVVVIKLWVAAADDAELHDRLAVAEREIARSITGFAIDALGDLIEPDAVDDLSVLLFSALRGLALTQQFAPRTHPQRDMWPTLRAALVAAVES